jgi:hypothetical protein
LASRTARTGSRLAGLWLIVAAVMAVTGCTAPRYTYVADSAASAYFKVPYGWQKISDSSLSAVINGGKAAPAGLWTVGYDAAPAPAAGHVLSPAAVRPFVLGMVINVSSTARGTLTTNGLRDFFLPVTATARQSAVLQGFRLTRFRLLRDALVSPARGIHGVRDVFDYRYPDGHVVTFDQIALTNTGRSELYILLVHCVATCYSHHRSEIDTVMSSLTVRSPR